MNSPGTGVTGDTVRVPLFDRLPEIYRERDAKQIPAGRLESFLGLVEGVFGEIHENIETLYHDLFIETCDDWVIPYIADLLGLSHLSGDPWTLRADVANTIRLRRRKGTLGAIELLTYSLTQWGVHAVELYRNLVWAQHLNHQRPDAGGPPPYAAPTVDRYTVVRGGTAVVRDPATLALIGTPFDPFAHFADLRKPTGCDGQSPACVGSVRHNLPNLAIFLWRLETYRVQVTRPVWVRTANTSAVAATGVASRVACFEIHPLGAPVRLFNKSRFEDHRRDMRRSFRYHVGREPEAVDIDDAPGPILSSRLHSMRPPMYRGETRPTHPAVGDLWLNTSLSPPVWEQWLGASSGWAELDDPVAGELTGGAQGEPEAYVSLEVYDDAGSIDVSDRALQLHLPRAPFHPFVQDEWRFRGANLCAWERGLKRPLALREVAIDPVIGRIAIGVDQNQALAVKTKLLVTYTYGTVGPLGAHPVDRSRDRRPEGQERPGATIVVGPEPDDPPPEDAAVQAYVGTLQEALTGLAGAGAPVVVEVRDGRVHDLDPSAVDPEPPQAGGPNLRLGASLTIRAGDGERPIIRLAKPLRFRPKTGDRTAGLTVRLEGLYLARAAGFPAGEPLIARAALDGLELYECTLDPGGRWLRDRSAREPVHPGIRLGAADPAQFRETPRISLRRTITGPLYISRGHRLCLADSIVDAGYGVGDAYPEPPGTEGYALSGPGTSPQSDWGPETEVEGVTFFGRVRVETLRGRGGLWLHRLEVLNNQVHCVKYSYFSGDQDRLPQNHACVFGRSGETTLRLRFTSEAFGEPGYGQLSLVSDFHILERGPGDDAMGAFGFLKEAHKWRNLEIRYREFMPVGVRPLLVPVT